MKAQGVKGPEANLQRYMPVQTRKREIPVMFVIPQYRPIHRTGHTDLPGRIQIDPGLVLNEFHKKAAFAAFY
mgnify:CR=1 FL=1